MFCPEDLRSALGRDVSDSEEEEPEEPEELEEVDEEAS